MIITNLKPIGEKCKMVKVESKGSFLFSEVKSFIYGGFSSRFWMLRKQICSIEVYDPKLKDLPFYSWQCITIELGRRDVDLIIPNERDMLDFLTLLICKTNTINGIRDSADLIKLNIIDSRVFIIDKKIQLKRPLTKK